MVPDVAHRVDESGAIKDVSVGELAVDERFVIRPGEQVPIDGRVTDGTSSMNEAFLTGESKPVTKTIDDEVVAGAINGEGVLTASVTRIGDDTTLSQIMRLVADAQASRSRFQQLADRAAFWLTIVAIGVAGPTFAIWIGVGAGVTFAVTRAVTVLVIACPHALGLAVPLVTSNATAMAARNGVLVRNREAFERGRDIGIVAFDKTGTLTLGNFALSSVDTDGLGREQAVRIAASLERGSEHPLARVFAADAAAERIEPVEVNGLTAVPGFGLTGVVDGVTYRIGRPEWASDLDVTLSSSIVAGLVRADNRGDTAVVLMDDERGLAVFAMADVIRPSALQAVESLRSMDVEPVMITGDAEAVARTVADELGIKRFYARVLPQQKADIVHRLQGESKVAFVGDGINDAPSLLSADLGIAIGAGTNVAIESADLVLIEDDPSGVAKALNLSRLTRSKMMQNLAWATGYNVIAIPLAAGIGVAAGILLNPAVGALLMSMSTVIVAINAMTMRRRNIG
jgi:Cu2+-exporting ATPase